MNSVTPTPEAVRAEHDRLHPYTAADLERVFAYQIREGDLLASAGEVGSGRYAGEEVRRVQHGHDESWITVEWRYGSGPTRETTYKQPHTVPMWRVKADIEFRTVES